MHYAIYDAATGLIRMRGFTSQPETLVDDLKKGELLFSEFVPLEATHILRGKPVHVEKEKSYIENRILNYPAVGEQLAAIAELAALLRESGVAIPAKTSAWLDMIEEVKAAYPKEADNAAVS